MGRNQTIYYHDTFREKKWDLNGIKKLPPDNFCGNKIKHLKNY